MKRIKKMLSVFLALVMAVSVLAGTGVQVQAASSKQVVYFNNSVSDWSNVYAYVWGSGLTTKAIKGTKVADDVYKMEIPAEYSKILFKNTSGTSNWDKKTANTTIPTDGKNCFKPKSSSNKSSGTWSTYTAVTATPKVTATTKAKESDETITFYYDNSKTSWSSVHAYVWGGATTTTVKGTSVGSNVYAFTISSSYKNVLFKNTSGTSSWDKQTADAGAPQTGKIFVPSSSSNKTGGSWKGYTATATPTVAPVDYMSFSYDNSKTKWSNVYVYAWVEGDASVTPVIEKSIACIDNEVYYFKVPTTYKNILFKNVESTSSWDQQTADTVMPTDYCQRFFTYSGANKTDGYWKEVLPFTTTPPAPVTTPPVTTPPVTTPPAPVTTPPVNTVTFYYDNSKTNWSNVHAYVWGGDTTTTVQGTKTEDNVYSFTVSSNYQNVLFKNTSGTSSWDRQTADAGKPQAGKIFTPSSSANKTGGSWNDYIPASPTPTPTPVNYKKVSYDNSKTNWSKVYAYVWVEGDSSVAPVTLEAASVSGNTYTFEVASTYKNILFKNLAGTSNWDKQTADTTVPTADGYIFITYSGANKTDGYWKEIQTSNVKRRALVLGETSTRAVPLLDVTSMVKTFENFTFDGKPMDEIIQYNDHTIAEITSKIQTVFADTTDEDISYIYMTCHGGSSGSILIGSDGSYTGARLRDILDRYVKGEVVLMIDCCYSGTAINKETDNSTDFVDTFLADFMSAGIQSKSGELAAKRFHVICSSNKDETSAGGSTSLATRYWEKGLGWLEASSTKTSLFADTNEDNKVTLAELYDYAYPLASYYQHMVVYPEKDDLVIGGRY